MTHLDHIKSDNWYAWYPVKTENEGWVWLCWTQRTIDSRPLVYLGLLETKTHLKL